MCKIKGRVEWKQIFGIVFVQNVKGRVEWMRNFGTVNCWFLVCVHNGCEISELLMRVQGRWE